MSRRPDNVTHLSDFNDEGGYRLPNGNLLTQEIALKIGENAGLFMGGGLSIEQKMACEKRYVLCDGTVLKKEEAIRVAAAEGVTFDETLSSEELEKALLSHYGEACSAMLHPYYIPLICHSPPRPPMLIFSVNCTSRSRNSEYTINLNSLWPTGNSPIQTEVPYHIKTMLR